MINLRERLGIYLYVFPRRRYFIFHRPRNLSYCVQPTPGWIDMLLSPSTWSITFNFCFYKEESTSCVCANNVQCFNWPPVDAVGRRENPVLREQGRPTRVGEVRIHRPTGVVHAGISVQMEGELPRPAVWLRLETSNNTGLDVLKNTPTVTFNGQSVILLSIWSNRSVWNGSVPEPIKSAQNTRHALRQLTSSINYYALIKPRNKEKRLWPIITSSLL